MESLRILHDIEAQADIAVFHQLSDSAHIEPFALSGDVLSGDSPTVVVLTPKTATLLLDQENNHKGHLNWVVVIVRDRADSLEPKLLQSSRVAAVLDSGCSVEATYSAFKSAITLLEQRHQLNAAEMLTDILEVGRALMQEKDLDTLLQLILTYARKLTGADGASIYTRDKDGTLYFRLWQNASTQSTANAQKTLVGDYSIAGHVAKIGQTIVIDDAYHIPSSAPYKFNSASDSSIGYHTQSVLTAPLLNKANEVVGVLQLINKKTDPEARLRTREDCTKYVVPFDRQGRLVAEALAGQAGVALENSILYSDIEELFEGFIMASVRAIEARDPTTAGHSFRVAEFCTRLAKAVDRASDKTLRQVNFSKDELKELRYAALLHDFGKVGVRENVLVKANKLYPHEIDIIKHKFRYARSSLERHAFRKMLDLYAKGELSPKELEVNRKALEQTIARDLEHLDRFLEMVLKANEPSVLHQDVSRELDSIAAFTFPGESGEPVKLLEEFEFRGLALSKGSLTEDERREIESHVSHTFSFLSLIPWTKNLANLPHIAHGHHEKLDGTGYPLGLKGEELPVQTRIMTISDIYDALTASDRPYKRALSPDRALDILASEVKTGKLDNDLFRIFVETKAYTLDFALA
ncbi:MAG: GAF domain-containing protein [Gammaproteobacteria bacterium]|nr:GAF domain-containing protein [Gammaproteobacteria bacterium]